MQLFASLREGSDGHNQAGAAVKLISIHAPVKGATARRRMMCRCVSNFNPRSREGSDGFPVLDKKQPYKFQSTLP